MSTHYVPSEAERALLDFARRALGRNLSEFLLCGLGETDDTGHLFEARVAGPRGRASTYHLEVMSEDGQGVPAGRDPLVLAALLRLLLAGGAGRDEVGFRDEALLAELGWADTPESRVQVAASVERYFSTAYGLRRTERRGPGRGEARYSLVQKLITGYEMRAERRKGKRGGVLRSTVVHFSAGFHEGVTGGGKHFLGVDFERLRLERILPEGAEPSG